MRVRSSSGRPNRPSSRMRRVLPRLELCGVKLALDEEPPSHQRKSAIEQFLRGGLGPAGKVVKRHAARLRSFCSAACLGATFVAMRSFGGLPASAVALWLAGRQNALTEE